MSYTAEPTHDMHSTFSLWQYGTGFCLMQLIALLG